MSNPKGQSGYVGRVPNAGAAVVQAPNQKTGRKTVTAHRGDDLRAGKGKK